MSEVTVVPVVQSASPTPKVEESVTATQTAPVVVEAPVQESTTPPEKPEDSRMARRFSDLAKRNRELVQKEQELKAREESLSPLRSAIGEAKKNPLKVLEAAGLTYEEITEFILSDGESVSESPTVESKLQALEEKLSAKERAEEEARQQEANSKVQAQISAFKENIREAASSPEFELVHTMEQHDLVYDVILQHHATHGEVLPINEALKLTEAYLEAQAQKLLQANKFRPQVDQKASAPSRQEPQPTKFTLSQRTATPTSVPSSQRLTPEQAKARAASMLRFQK